jgi:putative sigma-54 modulation protein
MQINITARHLDLTPAIADYVHKKVEKCERYFDHLVWAQVILSVEKYRQVAEIVIHAAKNTFRSKEESIDLYAAIDLALEKIEKQLKKYKEKHRVHRKKGADKASMLMPVDESIGQAGKAESKSFAIGEIKRFDLKPLSTQQAINEMEMMGYKFYMFLNIKTSQVNVVYVKDNGSYGIIEPQI